MKKLLIRASSFLLTVPFLQAAVIVDDFSDSGDPSGTTFLLVTSSNPVDAAYGESLLSVLGMRRQTTLTAQTPSSPSLNLTFATISDGPSNFDFASSVDSDARISFRYGSAIDTGNPADSVPLNLDAVAANTLELEVNIAAYNPPLSGAPLLATVTLHSNGNTASSVSQPLAGTAGALSVDFTSPAFNGIDLTDIDGISVSLDGAQGADFSGSSIQLVPEASTAILINLVLTFGAFVRRR